MADDECCSPRFQADALAGAIAGDTWTCHECGCTWKATAMGPTIRAWVCQDEAYTLVRMRG